MTKLDLTKWQTRYLDLGTFTRLVSVIIFPLVKKYFGFLILKRTDGILLPAGNQLFGGNYDSKSV